MSRKSQLLPKKIASAQSLGASFNGTAVNVQYQDNIGVQINRLTSAAEVGTFTVQGSLDGSNWVDLTTASTGGGFSIFFDLSQRAVSYVRVNYTRTSGSGTVDILVAAKQV